VWPQSRGAPGTQNPKTLAENASKTADQRLLITLILDPGPELVFIENPPYTDILALNKESENPGGGNGESMIGSPLPVSVNHARASSQPYYQRAFAAPFVRIPPGQTIWPLG